MSKHAALGLIRRCSFKLSISARRLSQPSVAFHPDTPSGHYSNSVLIITLAYQYASCYHGVQVRYYHDTIGLLVHLYVLQQRVSMKVSIY
jgi:hypothetical protein